MINHTSSRKSYNLTLAVAFLVPTLLLLSLTPVCCNRNMELHFNIEDGSYSLDVKIASNVPEVRPMCDHASEMNNRYHSQSTTDHLEAVFTNASQLLHQATNFYAHIGLVRFILPDNWSRDNLGGVTQCFSGSTKPAINIFKNSGKTCARAYVRTGNARCGEQSRYAMELPVETLNFRLGSCNREVNNCPYKSPAKLLVHEFAHLRWGLRDEYAEDGERLCPKALKQSHAYATQQRASLMAEIEDENVVHFCSNSTDPGLAHDNTTDSRQNNECGGRSSWEVMKTHEDFRSYEDNLTRKDNQKIQPTFLYLVRCPRDSTVFLVDQSTNQNPRFFNRTAKAMRYYINKLATEYSSSAFITYGGNRHHQEKRLSLTITNTNGRHQLAQEIKLIRDTQLRTYTRSLARNFAEAREAAYKLIGEPPLSDDGGTSTYQIIVLSSNMANYSQHLCSPQGTNFRLDEFFIGSCPGKSIKEISPKSCPGSSLPKFCPSPGIRGKSLKKLLRKLFQNRTRLVQEGRLKFISSNFTTKKPTNRFVNISSLLAVMPYADCVKFCLHVKIEVSKSSPCATTNCSFHVGIRQFSNSPCFLKEPVRLETVPGREGAFSYLSQLKVPNGLSEFLLAITHLGGSQEAHLIVTATAKQRHETCREH